MSTLEIAGWSRSRHQLAFRYRLDDHHFSTSIWYDSVDLPALETKWGERLMETVYFHIALFDANKLTSLAPETLDLGPFAHCHTPAFEELWRAIWRGVWAQWRYQNDRSDYDGPRFVGVSSDAVDGVEPVALEPSPVETLAFCGGGKDSLVAIKLLEEAGLPFATYGYSDSIYGAAAPQHELIEALASRVPAERHHRQWIFDDFMDSPIVALDPEHGATGLIAAETPRSVFAALPLALAHGYRHLVVAHEKSADRGNLTWPATGEEVNHQWGKSLEAESLLASYVRRHLIADCNYFSVLKPIHDVLIFNLLRAHLDLVPRTHSCNVRKPWCCRCAKCAYVWLGYMAYLPVEVVDGIFDDVNLFDLEENQHGFRQLLGLTEHTPFECIGEVDEARLAFELCRRKGLEGRAMDVFVRECRALDYRRVAERYLEVHAEHHRMPAAVASKLLPRLEAARVRAREHLESVFGSAADPVRAASGSSGSTKCES